jgi:hypothetical protein
VPSADTLLRKLTELSADNQAIKSSAGNSYKINIPEKLLDLNIKMLLKLKLINKKELQDFDFDNQILAHEKYDPKRLIKWQQLFRASSRQTYCLSGKHGWKCKC